MSCDGLGTIEGEIEFSIIEDETHELLKYPHEIPNEGQFISVLKRTRTIIREDNNGGRTAEHIVLTYYNIKILEFNFKYKGTESGKDYYDCYIDFA